MLKLFLKISSAANVAGGLVLILTWASYVARVPIIVLFIGLSLLIQGGYTLFYLHAYVGASGEVATGALIAGEALAACVGAAGFAAGIIHNIQYADMEMAPVLAGILMLVQAVLALSYLFLRAKLRPV